MPRQDTATDAIMRKSGHRNASIISLTSAFPNAVLPITNPNAKKDWKWLPNLSLLRTHYIHDLGFLACTIMLLSISVFFIACVAALPPIYTALDTSAKLVGVYWVPQLVGGFGFVVAGAMFMVETQEYWFWPEVGVLGWWIGGWNLIGGVGFTLCPIFGLIGTERALYQASLSSLWGSCAFFIGSVIQWYESMNKLPIEKVKDP